MKTLNIEVEGMNCGGCVKKITGHFESFQGVSNTNVNLENQTVTLTCESETSNMKIRNDLIELGFSVKSIKKA